MFKKKTKQESFHIALDEVFLDSSNLPDYDTDQFEGRIEKPISQKTFFIVGLFFLIIGFGYFARISYLQVALGAEYRDQSENNRLHQRLFFSDRGIIYDRDKELIAWNLPAENDEEFSKRKYIDADGFSNIVGYVKSPKKDSSGFYFQEKYIGQDGIEAVYDEMLSGENGIQLVEFNALNEMTSESVVIEPKHGDSLTTSLDVAAQTSMYDALKYVVDNGDFTGGAGILMDINTGELHAITTYPEYDSEVMTIGTSTKLIQDFITDPDKPFLNRAISGLYAPGSTIKPYVGIGALKEGVVTPSTKIVSTGSITVPNPYFPDKPSVFNDNKAHGAVNISEALAVSSNVYFYTVGGGFGSIKGLGIDKIEEYVRMFGFGEEVSGELFSGESGVVPDPAWKEKVFNGDPWRLGDTYYTSIGQYGFQTTPLQVVIAMAALANGGNILQPTIFANPEKPEIIRKISYRDDNIKAIREGLRGTVVYGTSKALNLPYVEVAGKTGTAEVGIVKSRINSWFSGYFPYKDPKYAFVILLERGPSDFQIGANTAALHFFNNLNDRDPGYFDN